MLHARAQELRNSRKGQQGTVASNSAGQPGALELVQQGSASAPQENVNTASTTARVEGSSKEKTTRVEGEDTPNQGQGHKLLSPEGKRASTARTGSALHDASGPGSQSDEDDDMKSLFGPSVDGDEDFDIAVAMKHGNKKRLSLPKIKFSKEEMDSMVVFLADNGFTEVSSRIGLADWKRFHEQVGLLYPCFFDSHV